MKSLQLKNLGTDDKKFINAVYNSDGTLASAKINGDEYIFTYKNGKISTATGGGVTKTYSWSGDQLLSVVIN